MRILLNKAYNRIGGGKARFADAYSRMLGASPPARHLVQRGRGGASLEEAFNGGLLQRRHLSSHLGAFAWASHHLPHRRGDLLLPLGRRHAHGGPDALREHHGVLPLLGEERPRDHGHAVHQALQDRVPPAVHQEAPRGLVSQHLRLRRPRRHQQAHALGPLHEPRREVRQRVLLALRVVVVGVDGPLVARAPHHPQEPLPAELQPQRQLVHLLRRQRAPGAERDEDDGFRRLPVEPVQARGARRVAGDGRGVGAYDRTDAVHGRAAGLRAAEHRGGVRLEDVEGVDQDGVGLAVAPAMVHHPPVARAGLVLQRREDVRPRDGHAAGEPDGLGEVAELAGHGDVELREVEDEGEPLEVPGEEEAPPRHAGGHGGVERVGPEEVGEVGHQARGLHEPREYLGQRRHQPHALLGHEHLDGGVGRQVGEVDGREGEGGDGRREGGEEGPLRGGGRGGEGDERGLDGVPRGQALGQLGERDEVAHPGRHQHRHVRWPASPGRAAADAVRLHCCARR
ncbi:hypothetical protein VPH35_042364 [Triticum aestivum]